MFTECPSCQTVFRVREPQLQAREGMVRCGLCRQVFDATRNLVDETGRQAAAPPAPGTEPAASERDDAGPGWFIVDEQPAPAVVSETVDSPALRDADAQRDGRAEPSGDSVAEETDAGYVAPPIPPPSERSEFGDGEAAPAAEPARSGRDGAARERSEPPAARAASPAPTAPRDTIVLESPDGDRQPLTEPEATTGTPSPKGGARARPRSVASALGLGTAVWALGAVFAGLLLAWQIRMSYVHDLAQVAALRPGLEYFCLFTGCVVPRRTALARVELLETQVSAHPDEPGALRLQASLINRATFEQPYPMVQVTLTDASGVILGRRAYRPEQYLETNQGRGTEVDRLLIPNVAQVITLDLAAPDSRALGYEVELVRREAR